MKTLTVPIYPTDQQIRAALPIFHPGTKMSPHTQLAIMYQLMVVAGATEFKEANNAINPTNS